MSTLLEPDTASSNQNAGTLSSSANQVRAEFAACRVKFRWFGTTKTLSASQKSQAANSFGAEAKAISAAKRLFDTKDERYRALTSLKSQIIRYWKDHSLAYPEAGIRLIKQNRIDEFNHTLRGYEEDLQACVGLLDEHFNDLRNAAKIRLGTLFNMSDYPLSLADEYAVEWDYPNVSSISND